MINFTSALYLGLRHPSRSLRCWEQLTLGVPAALAEPPGAAIVAAGLAALQGCERAILLPSTLHLFLDLFKMLAGEKAAVYADAGSYPIACWGAERSTTQAAPLHSFPHHDPAGLERALLRSPARLRRPIVLADGFCPTCGRSAPLSDYAAIARRFGGYLVIDDTQALGILGQEPGPGSPYGYGGGGSLRWHGLREPDILVGASLAKGFGVPVAVLAGSAAMIGRFAAMSATRVHCSPPSAAAIRAAAHALAVNHRRGDALRWRLLDRVRRFRSGLAGKGLAADGGLFPVQTLRPIPGLGARQLHWILLRRGIRTVPLRRRIRGSSRVGFLITASHTPEDINRCVSVLADVVDQAPVTGTGSDLNQGSASEQNQYLRR